MLLGILSRAARLSLATWVVLAAIGYHVTAWDATTAMRRRRIDSAKMDDWVRPTLSWDASTFAARTHAGIQVWDVATGKERPVEAETALEPSMLVFSPDSKALAAGYTTGEVVLWEVPSGRLIARIPGQRQNGKAFEVVFLTFAPDGRSMACGDLHRKELRPFHWELTSRIRLIDLAKHAARATIAGSDNEIFTSAAFSPDGTTIATASFPQSGDNFDGRVSLWDAATGKQRASVGRARRAETIAYAADSSIVMADREWIVLRDPMDLRERVVLYQGGFNSREETIALSRDGRTLASTNGNFKLWDLRAAFAPPKTGGHRFEVTCMAYAPDGQTLVSGSLDRTVKLWSIATRRPRATLIGHEVEVVRIAYAPDGRAIASVDAAGRARIWDAATGACRLVLEGPHASSRILAFGPDGRTLSLIAWGEVGSVEVMRWESATGGRLRFLKLEAGLSPALALSADGQLCVCQDGLSIRVWNAAIGDLRSTIPTNDQTRSLLVSRDAQTVFQMTQNDSIVIHRESGGAWKPENLFAGDPTLIEGGSADPGKRMTATPDGRRLAVNLGESVRVFDTITRQPIALLPANAVTWLTLSPDGKSLAAGRSDGEILIYSLAKAAVDVATP